MVYSLLTLILKLPYMSPFLYMNVFFYIVIPHCVVSYKKPKKERKGWEQ